MRLRPASGRGSAALSTAEGLSTVDRMSMSLSMKPLSSPGREATQDTTSATILGVRQPCRAKPAVS
jgi:hypothetical protein